MRTATLSKDTDYQSTQNNSNAPRNGSPICVTRSVLSLRKLNKNLRAATSLQASSNSPPGAETAAVAALWVLCTDGCLKKWASMCPLSTASSHLNFQKTFLARTKTRSSGRRAYHW